MRVVGCLRKVEAAGTGRRGNNYSVRSNKSERE